MRTDGDAVLTAADAQAPHRSPVAALVDPHRDSVRALAAWDDRVFRRIAARHSPYLDRVLPPLSRAADHSVLWMGLSAGLWVTGLRGRQAAQRGLTAIAVASTLTNQVGKRLFGRTRPPLLEVPVARRLARAPTSASLPSGHAASAAAYAAAVSAVQPRLAVPVVALAAAVGYSRVYIGVHYPSDVLAGAAVGAAVGVVGGCMAPFRPPNRRGKRITQRGDAASTVASPHERV